MILSFEGVPAVGKSTTSTHLQREHGVVIVPEVNRLFARPKRESKDWYLHRQVARYEMASFRARASGLIVLDGDPYQPLWYNWIFADEDWNSVSYNRSFYRPEIEEGRMGFPDRYVFFRTSPERLKSRVFGRGRERGRTEERIQRSYQRGLRIERGQKEYFNALGSEFPGLVYFLESTEVSTSAREILSLAVEVKPHPLAIFDFLCSWLMESKPATT